MRRDRGLVPASAPGNPVKLRIEVARLGLDACPDNLTHDGAQPDVPAAGNMLDELVTDAGFLAAADPARLFRILGNVKSDTGRDYARLYVQAVHRLLGQTASQRAIVLDIVGHEHGWGSRLSANWSGPQWRCAWAHWKPSEELLTLEGHGGAVMAVALGVVDSRPVVATAAWIILRASGMRAQASRC